MWPTKSGKIVEERSSLEDLLFAGFIHLLNSLEQFRLHERSFFNASAIIICSFHLFVVTTLYDKLVGRFLRSSGLVTESGLAPRGNRAGSADGGLAFAAAVG